MTDIASAAVHAPSLLQLGWDRGIYRSVDRNGVTTVALFTTELHEHELHALLQFRFRNYRAVGFVDDAFAAAYDSDVEPAAHVAPRDLHLVALEASTGEILGYMGLKAPVPVDNSEPMSSLARPLFPVEESFGVGLYDRIPGIAALPARSIREICRFTRAQHRSPRDEPTARACVEVCVAAFRALAGPLRDETGALIGSVEDDVAKRNLDFFDFPTVTLPGAMGFEPVGAYLSSLYAHHESMPFAGLCADLYPHESRLRLIEQALGRPGSEGVRALLALKRTADPPPSSLEPAAFPTLLTTPIEQAALGAPERAKVRDAGAELRAAAPFSRLSVAEATALRMRMRDLTFSAGDVVVRQHDQDTRMFVIADGTADVRVDGQSVARLGPRDHFGEIALLLGGQRTADTLAVTSLRVLELTPQIYGQFVSGLTDVHAALASTARARLDRKGDRHA